MALIHGTDFGTKMLQHCRLLWDVFRTFSTPMASGFHLPAADHAEIRTMQVFLLYAKRDWVCSYLEREPVQV